MSTSDSSKADLAKLLSALASGAKAVNVLPLEDEFEYQKSFPEFAGLQRESRDALLAVLGDIDPDLFSEFDGIQDPILWEKCADACDVLIEQVEAYLSNESVQSLEQLSSQTHQKAQGSLSKMMKALVDMEKPQMTYEIEPKNDRQEPFIPEVHPDKPFSVTPLDITLQEGHGLDNRFGNFRKVQLPNDVVAPTHHAPHVYQEEIKELQYTGWQLQAPSVKPATIAKGDLNSGTWIDTEEKLKALTERLSDVREVAVDLEAHSYRSFSGMVCLMQISFREDNGTLKDYLIDTLALWNQITTHMAPFFANPSIVKVMHGADSDIQWLQRDFGIYVVNLFDTGRAARLLGLTSAGYAYALRKYTSVNADKTHQLSDWRQRPLPKTMQIYATMDTHYLLDVYDNLKYDLSKHPNPDVSIVAVLDVSRKVCLVRYDKDYFNPNGYKSLIGSKRRNKRTKSELSPRQERALALLYDWRDQTARAHDESLQYVCPNPGLLRLALACPTTVTALQSCLNPMPPLVLSNSVDILDIIKHAQTEGSPKASTVSRTNPLPDATRDSEQRDILSPVLGTEALYKQAGWTTPQLGNLGMEEEEEALVVTTTTDDDEHDSAHVKPRHLLMINSANKDYRSQQYTVHSLEMGDKGKSQMQHKREARGKSADGLGAARAAKTLGEDNTSAAPSLEEESAQAQQNAHGILSDMASKAEDLLGVLTMEEGEEKQEQDIEKEGAQNHSDDKEDFDNNDFEIPKSMREIYQISNRNRRRNKKATAPQGNNDIVMEEAEQMDVDALEKAEAVLASCRDGKGYFESETKRQRTKSEAGETDDISEGGNSAAKAGERDDDIAFMQQIGWVKSKQEAEKMMQQRKEDGTEEDTKENAEETEEGDKPEKSSFDYSNIGAIGAYNPNAPAPSNPYFSGVAVAGGTLTQGSSKNGPPKKSSQSKDKPIRSTKPERPEKREGRTSVYKKR